jgi:predicted Zn-dependent protease
MPHFVIVRQPPSGKRAVVAAACGAALSLGVGGGCCFWRNQNPVNETVVAGRQCVQQGVNALERRDLDEAERLLAQAVRNCPDDAAAHRHYAELLWRRGRTGEALKQAVEAAEMAPTDPATLLQAAELHLAAGQLATAVAYAERTIDLEPRSPEALAVLSRISQQAGDPRQALADAQRALRYDPRRRDMLHLSAELYRSLGDPNRALVNLQALADTYDPGDEPPQLFVDEARAYTALARHDDAARALHEAQRRGPATPEIWALLCEAEVAAGRPAAAHEAARQALALAPDDPRCRALVERTASVARPDAPLQR